MPVWLTGKVIGYALAGLLTLGVGLKLYSVVKNHFIDYRNTQTTLSNEMRLKERAISSYESLKLATELDKKHRTEMEAIKSQHTAEIEELRVKAEREKDVLRDRERMTRLAIEKPGLVEKLVNRATKARFDELESIIND